MEEFKTLEELKEEFGKTYDIKLYEMGISAMKEIARLNKIIDELEKEIKITIKKMSLKSSESSLIMKSSLEIILDRLKELKEEGKK